uniref:hypothetical protein n=1 Tax=Serratia marcescens TaxID=615 RepID=UPI001F4BCF1A|nr:hypothetical protein [Serratia marcescens]
MKVIMPNNTSFLPNDNISSIIIPSWINTGQGNVSLISQFCRVGWQDNSGSLDLGRSITNAHTDPQLVDRFRPNG